MDGVGRGNDRISYDVSSDVSNTKVPQNVPGVNTIISDSEQNNNQESANEEREAVDLGGVDTDKARHLNRAEQERIKEIGKRLGRKVVFEDFYSSDKFKGKKKIPDGYIDGKGDIHINFYAKRPIQFVFKHEITHYLKRTLALYQDFMNMVISSKAFENWLHNKGYASIDELKAEITDTYSEVEGFDEGKCYDEILADFCAGYLFGGEKAVSQKLIDAMEPKKKRKFVEVIKDIIDYFKKKFSDDDLKTEIATIENAFIKVYNEAVNSKNKTVDGTNETLYSYYDEFSSNIMQWSYSASTKIGDTKIFNTRKKGFVLLEATGDGGYIELSRGTYEEVKEIEQAYRERTDTIYVHTSMFRNGKARNSSNNSFIENDGKSKQSSGQIRGEGFQNDSTGSDEYLRTGDKGESDVDYSIPAESATDLLDRYDKGEITREELIEGIISFEITLSCFSFKRYLWSFTMRAAKFRDLINNGLSFLYISKLLFKE